MVSEEQAKLITFLLVEDDDDHAEIVIRSLRNDQAAKKIDRAIDGVEALQYLHGEGVFQGVLLPDVIFLDLKLPKKNGHEVLAEIKNDERLALIPVVILTTSDAEIDRLEAYRLHANSYLVKPLDGAQFKKMIQDMSLYWGTWNRAPQGG
jgi:CheY-like chemotaxis protein